MEHTQSDELTALQAALDALEVGDANAAFSAVEPIIAGNLGSAAAIHILGLVAAQMHEPGRMLELFQHAHELDPNCRDHADALAIAYAKLGRLTESLYYGKLAVTLTPSDKPLTLLPGWFGTFEQAFLNIAELEYEAHGNRLLALGNVDEALEMLRRSAEARAEDGARWRRFAALLADVGRSVDALLALKRAGDADTRPTALDEAKSADCLMRMGKVADARGIHDFLLSEGQIDAASLSQMLASIARDPDVDRAYLAQAEKIYCDIFAPIADDIAPSRAPGVGALKVGIVTSGLSDRGHLNFLWPLLVSHVFPRIMIYVYATDIVEDAVARRLRGAVTSWVDARVIDDLTLNTIIRNDGIHVLLDADGHKPGGRPGLFLLKPAPVQARIGGLPESAAAAGFQAVFGDQWSYPESEEGRGSEEGGADVTLMRVDGGLFRLPALKEQRAREPDFDGAILAVSLTLGDMTDAVIAALEAACARHEGLNLCFAADRLGGLMAVEMLHGMLKGTALEGRYGVSEPSIAHSARAMARAGAYLDISPCWPQALEEVLSQGKPAFVVRGALPELRLADSVMGALQLEAYLYQTPADAIAAAADACVEGPARTKALGDVAAALETAAQDGYVGEWGEAFGFAMGGLYKRFTVAEEVE